ncbi:VOC family protein [Neobacillus sp. PS3-34]|uniref:VOC family protein n=1 Tax=Neobacillus sp. PS3-34 TaxID=3070678 RepID=UPI0027E19644|nr:VOC family protein [Neobacillus sp. PS3-34]WML48747.1 VOC family protein [Neobacillus sp. PS3-34]
MQNEKQKVHPFLMFFGTAEEAMDYYTSIFDDSEIISISRNGANGEGEEGKVLHATFSIKGQEIKCIDSSIKHDFTFTPAISLYVSCDTEEEITHVYEQLSQDGSVLMPLSVYPFSNKFCWVMDKYGVSWQLDLPNS